MTLTISDWLYRGVAVGHDVLTIHEDYFLLTGGIERWLYRVVRKHGGDQEGGYQFTMRQLHTKSGSLARLSDFACDVRKVVAGNALPEYHLSLERNAEGDEILYFVRRSHLGVGHPSYELPRPRRRRVAGGISQSAHSFTVPAITDQLL